MFTRNVQASGKGAQVTVLSGPSPEMLPATEGELFDVIYVDSDHREEGVSFDSLQASRLLRDDGLIVRDDSLLADAVKQGADRACSEPGIQPYRIGKHVCYSGEVAAHV